MKKTLEKWGKYWKNAKNTGKVNEKILEKCKKKTGKVREIRQSKKVGTMQMSTLGLNPVVVVLTTSEYVSLI